MQKREKKASIFIWSVFLSLFLIISFVGISTKINKSLKNNEAIIKSIQNLPSSEIDYSNYTGSLYKSETESLQVDNNTVRVNVIFGGPIHYTNGSLSGVTVDTSDFLSENGNIILKNLGGYTKYSIQSSGSIIPEFSHFSIQQEAGNKIIEKTNGRVKNF